MSTNKITENLSWNAVKSNYHIGTIMVNGEPVQVNQLQNEIGRAHV